MNRLIIKTYRTTYQVTHIKVFSFLFALTYITGLNLVTIYGLSLLLDGLLPTGIVLKLFSWPYSFITSFTVLVINFAITPPIHYIDVEKGKHRVYTPIVIYSIISLILFLYTRCYDKIF
jgi:hypothetical protein